MTYPTLTELANAIEVAASRAFSSLFTEHPGHYYYCSLVTTGEALAPVIAAWTHEALASALETANKSSIARKAIKWSSADSPFYSYGEHFFEKVRQLFSERPPLNFKLSDEQWQIEYQLRLKAMEEAMIRLDKNGLFGTGLDRLQTVVLVEVIPPDYTNTERALRLNPPEALKEWLYEAGEEK